MKISSLVCAIMAAVVVVNGKECEKKCKSVCTLKGDPHLKDFNGKESMLHGKKNGKYVSVYKSKHGDNVRVKIAKNGKNEYISDVKIGKKHYSAKKVCSGKSGRILVTHRGLGNVNTRMVCAKAKKPQRKYLKDPNRKFFNVYVEKKHQKGDHHGRGLASGACVGGKHEVKCGCRPPAPSKPPTSKPDHGRRRRKRKSTCKTKLAEKCGTGSPKSIQKCAEKNNLSHCLPKKPTQPPHKPETHAPAPSEKPTQPPQEATCEDLLNEKCGGPAPQNCSVSSNDDSCTDFLKCVNDNGLNDCYQPVPAPMISNETVTCSSTCYAKGDPHFKTFFGEKYKTNAAGQNITMVSVGGLTVDAYVDPVNDKEYITKVSWGSDQIMTVKDCEAGGVTEREIDFANVKGTVTCAKPKKGFGTYGYHLNVHLVHTFEMRKDALENATFETFVQAAGGQVDSECFGAGDAGDTTHKPQSWSAQRLAKKFNCK